MSNLCKNCGFETSDKYCAHCSQSTEIKRISGSNFFQEFLFNNFTFHKGLPFTIKSLILHPKQVIEDYLSGKRVQYTGAVHFFLFYLILDGLFILLLKSLGIQQESFDAESGSAIIDLSSWMKSFQILTIALSSFSTFIIYRKKKYNLSEHLVINFYIWGICCFLYDLFRVVTLYKLEKIDSYILSALFITYFIRTFYDKKIRIIDYFKGFLCLFLFRITSGGMEQLIVIIYNLDLFK